MKAIESQTRKLCFKTFLKGSFREFSFTERITWRDHLTRAGSLGMSGLLGDTCLLELLLQSGEMYYSLII